MQKTHSEWNYKWNCLRRPYPLKFLKGCLPQNLLNPLLNTLPEISFTWILQILKSVNLWEKIHLILRLTLLQKEHKQLAFIMIHSIVKDKDGYILTGSVKRKFMVNLRPFHWLKTVDMKDYVKSIKRDFDPSLRILHIDTNDLSLKDTGSNI